jgi:hypothetical protein
MKSAPQSGAQETSSCPPSLSASATLQGVPRVLLALLDAGGESHWSPIRARLHSSGVASPRGLRESMEALGLLTTTEGPIPDGYDRPQLSISLTAVGRRVAARAKREAA